MNKGDVQLKEFPQEWILAETEVRKQAIIIGFFFVLCTQEARLNFSSRGSKEMEAGTAEVRSKYSGKKK